MESEFSKILEEMKKVSDSKSADYTSGQDKFENFKRAATLASWFTSDIDKVFATMIGIKLARLGALSNKEPNNESVRDSRLDLANYVVLWMSYHDSLPKNEQAGIPVSSIWGTGAGPANKPQDAKVDVTTDGPYKQYGAVVGDSTVNKDILNLKRDEYYRDMSKDAHKDYLKSKQDPRD